MYEHVTSSSAIAERPGEARVTSIRKIATRNVFEPSFFLGGGLGEMIDWVGFNVPLNTL